MGKLKLILFSAAAYLVSMFVYFLVWRMLFAFGVPVSSGISDIFNFNLSPDQQITVGTSASLEIYRFGFIPVYSSAYGDLSLCHIAYLAVTFFITLSILLYKIRKSKTLEFKLKFEP